MKSTRETKRKVNAIVEEVLDEDEEEPCPEGCDQDDTVAKANPSQEVDRRCKCAVENSWRFSLRVMEAMRSLQRVPDQPLTSTAEDIVEYIRTNYRSDGDLYAQVRTALRQVCSQGFVMELLENEYHLIGPVAKSTQPSGCSFDCEGRAFSITDDTPRRRRSVNDRKTDACRCRHSLDTRRNGPREHAPRETTIDHLEDLSTEDILHSTGKLTNDDRDEHLDTTEESSLACDCKDTARKERHPRRDDTERVHEASPIAGPSRVLPTSPTPMKKARLENRRVSHPRQKEENDEETTTEEEEEEDLDCTCDTIGVAQTRKRLPDRTPRVVIKNHRNEYRRKDVEDDIEEEKVAEEEDENMEDSDRGLRRRDRRGRSAAREKELKRWIRRCREECERRKAR